VQLQQLVLNAGVNHDKMAEMVAAHDTH
jgi:hypothetical protein